MLYNKNNFLLFIFLILLFNSLLGQSNGTKNKVIKKGNSYYLSNTIHVKLKHDPKVLQKTVELTSSLKKMLEPYSVETVHQTFTSSGRSLNRILTIEYSSPEDPAVVASKLRGADDVLWAEPHYVYKTEFVPTDPQYSGQWNLGNIQADLAWDITKGDTSVVIGIVDTGVDWDHPDLRANMWVNKNEIAGNGRDDDNNGYIDDIRGWDFGGSAGTADNNPNEDEPEHGTHVAGIASAVTNNDQGISSIGFNCKLLPVKVSAGNVRDEDGNSLILYGFEGIQYAAENGARIINCSFGGGDRSLLGQDIVNYAVSRGALIIAAAGNSRRESTEFPASYEGVVSVASVDEGDDRSGFSSYGFFVDVSAPGESIFSTWKDDTYNVLSGTSMASPLVAGLAGLVASRFPDYTPIQIGEQIRVNTDDIDNNNPPDVRNKIGRGRINALKALTNTGSKSVRAVSVSFSDNNPDANNNGSLERGEVVSVAVNFLNILNPIENMTITLENTDRYASVLNADYFINSAASLDSFNNYSNMFRFKVNNDAPNDAELKFLLRFNSSGYTDYQWVTVLANPTFKTQDANQIDLTLTSKGALGFNDYPIDQNGQGFRFRGGPNLLFEGAFMFGNSGNRVSDAARIGGESYEQSDDFRIVSPIVISTPGDIADQQGFASFSDSGVSPQSRFDILTEQHSYSFVEPGFNDFIILRYKLINNSSDQITNLYAGLFFDWDMIQGSGQNDIVNYNNDQDFGYVFHNVPNPDVFVGCALLTSGSFTMRGILNSSEDDIEIYSDFTDAEKWGALTSGLNAVKKGPGDVSMVAAGGAYNLDAGDTLDIAFSLAAGSSFEELLQAIEASRIKYKEIDTTTVIAVTPNEYRLNDNYPNPFNSTTTITYLIPRRTHVQLKVYDILGNEVATLVNREQEPDRYVVRYSPPGLASGVYMYRLITDDFTSVKKMVFLK